MTLLTRLPMPSLLNVRGARAAWAYPLAGLVVGLLAAVVGWLTGGLPPALSAGLALATLVILTGGMHEDGLADSVDGLWGGNTPERRLGIMADSSIGAYGVVALIFSIGLRWSALTVLAGEGSLWAPLIAAAVVSRAPMVWLMHIQPNARSDGLSQSTGRPPIDTALAALSIAAVVSVLTVGFNVLPIAVVLCVTTLVIAAISTARINGQSGDILGATQQVGEIAVLIVLVA